jgi:hypothetical protein
MGAGRPRACRVLVQSGRRMLPDRRGTMLCVSRQAVIIDATNGENLTSLRFRICRVQNLEQGRANRVNYRIE